MQLTYVGPHDEVEIIATGQTVARGGTLSVPAAVAGRAPSGDAHADGYDPGEGLLAQPDNWVPAKASPAKPAKEAD